MGQKGKIGKEFQADEDGTVVIPKETLPEVSVTALKKTVKRPLSDAQRANMEKMIAANKERWAKMREEKSRMAEEAVATRKAEDAAKVEAGTHIRVKLKEKAVYTKRPTPPPPKPAVAVAHDYPSDEESVEEKEMPVNPPALVRTKPRQKKQPIVYETDTPTETDDDYEEERVGKRAVRREVKKNLKAIERIENVLQAVAPRNPYLALLEARWK